MKRVQTESGLRPRTETKATQLLCEGHDVASVVERLGVDFSLVYLFAHRADVVERIEAARQARLDQAARDAARQAEEWAEQDRQEKHAATAIESAAIQLIPQRIAAMSAEERSAAVRDVHALADTFLKAQKGRRIASNRPVERTEVETNTQEAFIKRVEEAARLAHADDERDGCASDGVQPAQTTAPDHPQR